MSTQGKLERRQRLAINGYGRIGQCVLRALYEGGYAADLQVAAINELADLETIAYLTRYDTTHGRFPGEVITLAPDRLRIHGDPFAVGADEIVVYHQPQPEALPWAEMGIDLVLECTGVFQTRREAEQHLQAGAARLLFSHPADLSVDKTIVYGVNHQSLSSADRVVSNASCTTNAIVPVLDVLHRTFGIEQGMLTTVHSAMNDQPTIDAYHHHDLRRTRSSMQNIVPVETGLAKGIERLLPELSGVLSAIAIRVPTINVSAIDLTLNLQCSVSRAELNAVLQQAAQQGYEGVLAYTEEPLASSDFNHVAVSATVDGSQTRVSNGRLVKVWVWFDNEWAFANRMLDVARCWLQTTPPTAS